MRIIAGAHRGTVLTPVGKGDAAAQLRPTSDRVRESLFNVLQGGRFGNPVQCAHALDLFAGTGALGLEALSRGTQHVTFVDNGRIAQQLIRSNIARLRREPDCTVLATQTTRLGPAPQPCGLVFLDPPYGRNLGGETLTSVAAFGWIAPGAVVVWEEATPQMPPPGFDLLDQRRYGDTHITLLEYHGKT